MVEKVIGPLIVNVGPLLFYSHIKLVSLTALDALSIVMEVELRNDVFLVLLYIFSNELFYNFLSLTTDLPE